MKQFSIYDNEYLDNFDAPGETKTLMSQTKISMCSSATCLNLAKTPKDSYSNINAEKELKETKTLEQKVFPANVTEIVLTKDKIDSIQLILPMLINLHQEQRWLAWIDPPIQLLKEWQKTHNESALNDIMILRSNENLSVFELSKRALTAGTCHAVIAWTNNLSLDEFSKLETASSKGNSHGIILKSRKI